MCAYVRLCVLCVTVCDCARQCVTGWGLCVTVFTNVVGLSAPMCDCMRLYATVFAYVRLCAPICDCVRP